MKSNKREQILEAAAKVYGEKGFHLSTVEEIAREAGVGKGTIYQYFQSKNDIFTQLHDWFMQQYLEALDHMLKQEDSFANNLRRILVYHVTQMVKVYPIIVKMHQEALDMDVDRCEAMGAVRKVEARFQELVRMAIARDELREINPVLVVGYIEGVFVGMLRGGIGTEADVEEIADEIMTMLMQGLGKG